jgi:hypothetical protein
MTPAPRLSDHDVAEALAGLRLSVAAAHPHAIQAAALRLHGIPGNELAEVADDLGDELVADMLAARPAEGPDVARGVAIAVLEEALDLVALMPPAGRA